MQVESKENPYQIRKTFIIKPTMNCNLRCKYCFEFKKNGDYYDVHHLSIEYVENFILRAANIFPKSHILWLLHGGEPFITGPEYVRRLINCIKSANKQYDVDFQLAVQTNGTLLSDEYIKILEDNADILSERVVSISLDGPQEINDKVRLTAGGASSFSNVVDGIRRIQKSKLDFSTISVIGAHNVDRPEDVYNFMKEMGARLCKFIPCYNFSDSGKAERFGINPMQYAEFMCRVFDIWLHDLPKTPKEKCLVIDPIATILAKLSSVFVTWCEYRPEKCDNFVCLYPDGELWLCDTMDHMTMRDFGYIGNVKTLTDNEFKKVIVAPCKACRYTDFYGTMMETCRDCSIKTLCCGGCLPMRDILRKKSPHLLDDYCQAKKMLFSYLKRASDNALS